MVSNAQSERGAEEPVILGTDLSDKRVVDANGIALGSVTRVVEEGGELARIDVRLFPQAREVFGVTARELTDVPADAIARVDADVVRLKRAGDKLLESFRRDG